MTAPEPAITGGRVARQAPGGASTLCFGDDTANGETVSSNAFAQRADQNCGNVITDRPTTGGVRHAPGGASTIILGGDDPAEAFVRRTAPQNISMPEQEVVKATGGKATIVLGGDVSFEKAMEEAFIKTSAPQNTIMP